MNTGNDSRKRNRESSPAAPPSKRKNSVAVKQPDQSREKPASSSSEKNISSGKRPEWDPTTTPTSPDPEHIAATTEADLDLVRGMWERLLKLKDS